MQRVHPDFIGPAYRAAVEGKNVFPEQIAKGLQYWTGVLHEAIGIMDPVEAPLVIAALKEMADAYSEVLPGAGGMASDIQKLVSRQTFVIKVRKEHE